MGPYRGKRKLVLGKEEGQNLGGSRGFHGLMQLLLVCSPVIWRPWIPHELVMSTLQFQSGFLSKMQWICNSPNVFHRII